MVYMDMIMYTKLDAAWYYITVKPVCNDHLYNKLIACDLFSNVF